MQDYLNQMIPTLDLVLRQPGSDLERWLLLGLTLAGGTLALWLLGKAFRWYGHSPLLCAVAVACAGLAGMAGLLVMRLHPPPGGLPALWALSITAALALGALIVKAVTRIGYGPALAAWGLTLAAMAGLLFMGRAGLQSFATGERQTGGLREHHRQLRSLTGE